MGQEIVRMSDLSDCFFSFAIFFLFLGLDIGSNQQHPQRTAQGVINWNQLNCGIIRPLLQPGLQNLQKVLRVSLGKVCRGKHPQEEHLFPAEIPCRQQCIHGLQVTPDQLLQVSRKESLTEGYSNTREN